MLFLFWLPNTVLPTLCMMPVISVAGMLSPSRETPPVGSLEGDLA